MEDENYVIDRAKLEAVFAEPAALARTARIVPKQVDGKTVGFRLSAANCEKRLG